MKYVGWALAPPMLSLQAKTMAQKQMVLHKRRVTLEEATLLTH